MALANELSLRGWRSVFFVSSAGYELAYRLNLCSHTVFELRRDCEDMEELKELSGGRCDLLVVDHYDLDARYETSARPWASKILVIDDLAGRKHDCDVLVDQNLDRNVVDYLGLVPQSNKALCGPTYALLREEFSKARFTSLSRRSEMRAIKSVLVSMGYGQVEPATMLILTALHESMPSVEVDVILPFDRLTSVGTVSAIKNLFPDARVHFNAENVAKMMSGVDFAIGAGGVTAFERCCLGLPSIIITLSDNQRLTARGLHRRRAALYAGDVSEISVQSIVESINHIDSRVYAAMHEASREVCDGRGVARVVDQVAGFAENSIVLRPADFSDADLLLGWRNDEATRVASRSSVFVDEKSHFDWLQLAISDPLKKVMIAQWWGIPVGVVRADERDNRAELSWTVAPEFRGLGMAKRMLTLMMAIVAVPSFAHVRRENVASQRVAESAGMQATSVNDEWITFG
jgi:UDP-2,4-diacetamido-2,4,6-trideoxy-beta-L-altropyranose hydrolase